MLTPERIDQLWLDAVSAVRHPTYAYMVFARAIEAEVRKAIAPLPTNDEVYAEVCAERGKSMLYVSTNAVNDVMQAVRKLVAATQPKQDTKEKTA